MIRFRNYIDVYSVEKNDNYVVGRRDVERQNRTLDKIESYMRSVDLLMKDEYLEFSSISHNHIRLPYIEHICYRKEWLHCGHLKICK